MPLLLVIHGGPTGVFVRSFTGTAGQYPIAAFAARGYAVLRATRAAAAATARRSATPTTATGAAATTAT